MAAQLKPGGGRSRLRAVDLGQARTWTCIGAQSRGRTSQASISGCRFASRSGRLVGASSGAAATRPKGWSALAPIQLAPVPPSATERKPRLSAAEFRFDRIVSRGPASRRTDACSVSARCVALVPQLALVALSKEERRGTTSGLLSMPRGRSPLATPGRSCYAVLRAHLLGPLSEVPGLLSRLVGVGIS